MGEREDRCLTIKMVTVSPAAKILQGYKLDK